MIYYVHVVVNYVLDVKDVISSYSPFWGKIFGVVMMHSVMLVLMFILAKGITLLTGQRRQGRKIE